MKKESYKEPRPCTMHMQQCIKENKNQTLVDYKKHCSNPIVV